MGISIEQLVNDPSTPQGRAFALTVQFLILVSLVSFTLDTLPNIGPTVKSALSIIEYITVAIFTLEYLLRIYVASSKPKFIFSFYGMVDLLAILPFYISSGVDLRAVRVFRFLRLLRILKLARYNAAIRRFHRAFVIVREELALLGVVALIILYLSAVGIYYFESDAQMDQFQSVLHSLWWAVTTLTTVGYGDMYPVTAGGKLFTFFVLIVGLGVVAVPTGLIASALTQARDEERADAGFSKGL